MIQPLEQLHQYTHQIHQLHNSFQLQFKFLKLRKVLDKDNVKISHFKHFFFLYSSYYGSQKKSVKMSVYNCTTILEHKTRELTYINGKVRIKALL